MPFPKLPVLFALSAATLAFALDRKFPAGAGVIDVRGFGVKGDGINDDTRAIQALIDKHLGSNRYLYFPAGTYRISGTLSWKHANGIRDCGLSLIGESRTRTVLKLADRAAGFGGPYPKPLLLLYSQTDSHSNMNRGPAMPGSAENNGNGNSAFLNSIMNLTVDVGSGNPGAVGIDALINNIGRIRDVTIRSSDPRRRGVSGIDMLRGNPGPLLIKSVSVDGFDYGMRVDGDLGSITMEHILLRSQAKAGIRNCQNTLIIRDLAVRGAPVAVENAACGNSDPGMVSLIDASLETSAGEAAVLNEGSLFVRNLATRGFRHALRDKGRLLPGTAIEELETSWKHGVNREGRYSLFVAGLKSLNLPVEETPEYFDPDPSHWAVVKPDGDADRDDCDSLRAALQSGKPTVFLRRGAYTCGETLVIPGNVRHLLGDNAWLGGHDAKDSARPRPLLDIREGGPPLIVENVDFRERLFAGDQSPNPGLIIIEHASARALVLNGAGFWGDHDLLRPYLALPGAGNLFLEDVTVHGMGPFALARSQSLWARQFNPEGSSLKLLIDGASAWILGLKTENPGTVIRSRRGGEIELLGGMVVPVNNVDTATPAFQLEDSRASLTYSFLNPAPGANPHAWYECQVREIRNGEAKSMPWSAATLKRGNKNLHIPLYVAGKREWSAPVPIVAVGEKVTPAGQGPRSGFWLDYGSGAKPGKVFLLARDSATASALRRSAETAMRERKPVRLGSVGTDRVDGIAFCDSLEKCPEPED